MLNSKLLLSVFSLLLLIAQPSRAAPVNILPLGNSITSGTGFLNPTTIPSYRNELADLLTSGGYDFDYVGTEGTDPLLHEGVSGIRADEILNGSATVDPLATKLTNYDIDIVLLHSGTNDILQNDVDDHQTLADIEGIISALQAKNTNVTVYVAKIIPINDPDESTGLNALLTPAWAATLEANVPTSTIKIVDQHTGITAVDLNADLIHPNQTGEDKMAQKWFDAISADFTAPTDLPVTTGLTLHLDASDSSTITTGSVFTWNDKSGQENHVTQVSGTTAPAVLTGALNGKDVLDFDNSRLETPDDTQITADSSYTKFVVFKYDTAGSNNLISSESSTALWAGSGSKIQIVHISDSTASFLTLNDTDLTNYHIASARYGNPDGLENVLSLDRGAFTDTDTAVHPHIASITNIGAFGSFANTDLDGKIAEAIIYDRALTDAEIDQVETYLNDKWFTLPGIDQTITFAPPANKIFGDLPFTVSATTTATGLTVAIASDTTAVCTIDAANQVTILTGGTCTLTASQAGDTSYNAATPVSKNITVAAIDQTITFTPPTDKVFGDAPFTVTATTTATGLTVAIASDTTAVCTIDAANQVTILTGGTCTLTASQVGDASYNAAIPVSTDITFNKATQTIGAITPTTAVTFGDADFTVSATATSGLAVSFGSTTTAVCTVTPVGVVTITGAGTCSLTADQAGNSNYNAATQVTADITVNQVTQTIGAITPTTAVTFDDADFTVSATATSGLAVSFGSTTPAVCTVTSAGVVTITGAGTCSLTADQAGDSNYNAATQVTANITVYPPANNVVMRAELSKAILQAKYGNGFVPDTATGFIYTDVQLGDFNADWIEKLTADGISEGCLTNNYCPNMVVTKEQLAKILLKAKHGSEFVPPVASGNLFTDVTSGSFAVDWIEELFNQGISQGCDADNFCPKEAVTVETLVTMLDKTFP